MYKTSYKITGKIIFSINETKTAYAQTNLTERSNWLAKRLESEIKMGRATVSLNKKMEIILHLNNFDFTRATAAHVLTAAISV